LDVVNNNDASASFNKADSFEVMNVHDQSKMIDAIRNEHARVYMQDQALLSQIKEQKSKTGNSTLMGNLLTNSFNAGNS
jgi:hypothetical protein